MVRRGASVLVLLFLMAACSSEAPAPPTFAGDWQGTMEVPGQPLPFAVHIGQDQASGTIDIPVQMVAGAPLSEVSLTGDAIRFALPDVPGAPVFTGTIQGEAISGTLSQGGQNIPFSLARGTLPPPARPQEPQPPYPYRSEDVTFPSGPVTLAGTVTTPEGPGPFPAVVMITGSGAQDRDETLASHKPFLVLADALTRAGFAVLRTDDRGVGGSTGTIDDTPYADLADDARAGVAFLRARPEVDPARVGLFGHSEGGYLAPLAAQRSAPGDIAFAVLMAGPAVPGGDVLIEQNELLLAAAGLPPDQVAAQVDGVRQLVERFRAGDREGARALARAQAVGQGLPADQADAAAAQVATLGPFLTYDPQPALRALRIPVFAFFGSKDLQVPPAQSEQPMREALAAAPGSEVRTFEGLNHLMQPAQTGSPAEYSTIETTIDPTVLDAVTQWLTAR
ncbi:alpha/beta hydrolase family protein [Pseudonocardia pini]|uniref:alpha/beta hydrolase family protein n=1 Tax=Pseudonocardia pini TaxID=2758030 RepID=UPI0015F0D8C8|nr:alpha/beta fold hydrolase [Pseudonocardia pini]